MKEGFNPEARAEANKQALELGIKVMINNESLWSDQFPVKENREAHLRNWLAGKIGNMEGLAARTTNKKGLSKDEASEVRAKAFEAHAKALRVFLPEGEDLEEVALDTTPVTEVSYVEGLQNKIDALKAQIKAKKPSASPLRNELLLLQKKYRHANGLADGSMTLESIQEEAKHLYREKVYAYATTDEQFNELSEEQQDLLIYQLGMMTDTQAREAANLERNQASETEIAALRARYEVKRQKICQGKTSHPETLSVFADASVEEYMDLRKQDGEINIFRRKEVVAKDFKTFMELQARWNALVRSGAELASQEMQTLKTNILSLGQEHYYISDFEKAFPGFEKIDESEFN